MTTTDVWLQKARDLAPVIAKFRDEGERERRLPMPLFDALCDAGLLHMARPKAFGGQQQSAETVAAAIEEIARHDGSVAWNLTILAGNGMLSEYLPADGAQEIFGDPASFVAGSFAVLGTGEAVEGGYRVSGRWKFASGSAHAQWLTGAFRVPDAEPVLCVVPVADAQIIDTWFTTGLRGTGSNDFVLDKVFVPVSRCFPLAKFASGPGPGAAYPRSFQDVGAGLLATVALGIARDAIESLKELAPGKTPTRSASPLSLRHTAQQKLGLAEGLLQAARTHLFDTFRRLDGPEPNSPELTNTARLAAVSAVESAQRAVSMMYELGGGTSIYDTSRLERCFRDVQVISHHALVSQNGYETAGAYLLSSERQPEPEPEPDDWLTRARELEPIVAQYRDESERERHLSAPVFEAMRARRLLSMMVSKSFGGSAVPLTTAVRVCEQVSQYDGAAGWNLVIGAGGALMADYLPEEHVPVVFGDQTAAGSFGATGTAIPVEGGYRVSGRWGFASGCHNATYFAGGCRVIDNAAPVMLPNGIPDVRIFMLPASECRIVDTWDSAGLRGTGSHDFEAQDVFVPSGRHVSFFGMREPAPPRASRAYPLSFFAQQGPLLGAVSLGIAGDALQSFYELANAKTPRGGSITLATQPTVQDAYGRASAALRQARALVYETTRAADALPDATPEQAAELAVRMRLAGVHAAAASIQAVDLVYDWAGTSSVYASSRIERCFRDVHVVSHHISLATVGFEMVGQYMLGGPFAQRR